MPAGISNASFATQPTILTGLEVTNESNEKLFSVGYGADAVAATTGYILIDISDSANYPHTLVDTVWVTGLHLNWTGSALAAGAIDIGFIRTVSTVSSNWRSITRVKLDTTQNAYNLALNFAPGAIKCTTYKGHYVGGTLDNTGDTSFQTDEVNASPSGNINPAIDDIIAKVTLSAGTVDFSAVVNYFTTDV